MREILFRGLHPCDGPDTIVVDGEEVKGRWVEGYIVRHPSAIQIGNDYSPWYIHVPPVDPDDNGGVFNVLPSTVGQYTGLTDRNGKRVFEGDIVRRETDYYGKHNIYEEPVVWENDIENDSFGEPYTSGYCIHGGNWEIIGTVFDEEAPNEA